MNDLISRQAAIDAHYEYCNKHPDAGFPVWSLKILEDLPSAQPEPCEDTISRKAAIDSICRTVCDNPEICESPCDEIKVLEIMPSAQPETHDKRTETHACDLIDRQAAIDALDGLCDRECEYSKKQRHVMCGACHLGSAFDVIEQLPPLQENLVNNSNHIVNYLANDTISRKAAIEAMEDVDWYHINKDGQLTHGANSKEDEPLYKAEDVYKVLNDMPSAQPEKRTEERTETHACDSISRQAAIDAMEQAKKQYFDRKVIICKMQDIVINLPSAQPEQTNCCYTNSWCINCKEYDKEKHSCPQFNRVIKQTLDEIIRCNDCKYYREYGYVNGKPKFLPKCTFNSIYVNADDFCSRAERRTDGV